jgi:hypothetical protein
MNATCERLLGTLRCELLDRILILSEAHLRAVLIEYRVHYNTARPHQGIAQRVPGCESGIPRVAAVNLDVQRIHRKPVLNGLIMAVLTEVDMGTLGRVGTALADPTRRRVLVHLSAVAAPRSQKCAQEAPPLTTTRPSRRQRLGLLRFGASQPGRYGA